jgi:hypothetical protein
MLNSGMLLQATFLMFMWKAALPLFSSMLKTPCPLCCLSFSISSLLLSCCCFFPFCRVGISLSRGLCWPFPGVTVGVLGAAYLLTCLSTISQAGLELAASGGMEASCFLSVKWCGEALQGLVIKGV